MVLTNSDDNSCGCVIFDAICFATLLMSSDLAGDSRKMRGVADDDGMVRCCHKQQGGQRVLPVSPIKTMT